MVIGFIYKIYDNTNGSVYYGSTKNKISQRMAIHRQDYKRWVDGRDMKRCRSFEILNNEDYAYSLVEQVEYENKMELLQRERWYIENNECVNKCLPARTDEENKEYNKAYREANIEQLKEQSKAYRETHKKDIAEHQKAYREANIEKCRERDRVYWEANKEKKNAKRRERYAKKKAKINEPSV